ncbi:unnamed protein product [Rhizophagus irregularis]|nr:unnamed protein product [Rhizophagus irregularis]
MNVCFWDVGAKPSEKGKYRVPILLHYISSCVIFMFTLWFSLFAVPSWKFESNSTQIFEIFRIIYNCLLQFLIYVNNKYSIQF